MHSSINFDIAVTQALLVSIDTSLRSLFAEIFSIIARLDFPVRKYVEIFVLDSLQFAL